MRQTTAQRLISEEVRRCTAFLRKSPMGNNVLKLKVPELVERSYHLHKRLIDRWGGWSFHDTEARAIPRSPAEQQIRAQALWREFSEKWIGAARAAGEERFNYSPHYQFIGRSTEYVLNLPHAMLYRTSPSSALLRDFDMIAPERFFIGSFPASKTEINEMKEKGAYIGHFDSGVLRYELFAKVREGQRIASVVLDALTKRGTEAWMVKAWEWLFQQLGEHVWTEGQVPTLATLTCAPSAFLRLGHYGEPNSCFRNGGASQGSKLYLASDIPDSFVLFFYRPDGKTKHISRSGMRRGAYKEDAIAARAFGVALPGQGACVTNFFKLPFTSLETVVGQTLKSGLGLPDTFRQYSAAAEVTEVMVNIKNAINTGLYLNRDLTLFCPEGEQGEFFRFYLDQVLDYTGAFGLHTNRGGGVNAGMAKWAMEGGQPDVWPYPDFNLIRIAKDRVAKEAQ